MVFALNVAALVEVIAPVWVIVPVVDVTARTGAVMAPAMTTFPLLEIVTLPVVLATIAPVVIKPALEDVVRFNGVFVVIAAVLILPPVEVIDRGLPEASILPDVLTFEPAVIDTVLLRLLPRTPRPVTRPSGDKIVAAPTS